MKRTITESAFIEAFNNSQLKDSFSDTALAAIFHNILKIEESTGVETELYIIDIATRWSECASILDFIEEFNFTFSDAELDQEAAHSSCVEPDTLTDEQEEEFMSWINSKTIATLMDDGGLVWLNF